VKKNLKKMIDKAIIKKEAYKLAEKEWDEAAELIKEHCKQQDVTTVEGDLAIAKISPQSQTVVNVTEFLALCRDLEMDTAVIHEMLTVKLAPARKKLGDDQIELVSKTVTNNFGKLLLKRVK